jgi:hypothetical protein
MHDVIQYFDLIANTVEFSFAESVELDYDRRDFSRGLVDGSFTFLMVRGWNLRRRSLSKARAL